MPGIRGSEWEKKSKEQQTRASGSSVPSADSYMKPSKASKKLKEKAKKRNF